MITEDSDKQGSFKVATTPKPPVRIFGKVSGMHTIAAKIILMDNVNDGSVEYPKPKANRIEAVSLSEPLCDIVG